MKRPWAIIGAFVVIAVLAGWAALQTRSADDGGKANYETAKHLLTSMYKGPKSFTISNFGDPETRVERTPGGYIVSGVIESDHPDVLAVASTGRVRFRAHVVGPRKQYLVFGPNTFSISVDALKIEPEEAP